MSKLFRFGISLSKDLIYNFDRLIREKGYTSRSKAIGDLIRQELIKKEWLVNKEVAAAITLVYNHHKRELLDKITDIQHDFQKIIISCQHIHLDQNNCLEIVAIRGKPKEAQKLANTLKAIKGIKHAAL
ncbi:MAG: nickel-responsive transcriptional regulator NikR, partial [Candidatus Omnitrophica bacterium]|nr:nickel-responsive transcriptional regulator NikR [Candidatus Omnitrophota bacterium]